MTPDSEWQLQRLAPGWRLQYGLHCEDLTGTARRQLVLDCVPRRERDACLHGGESSSSTLGPGDI